MYLDQTTADILSARFNNKFKSVQYAGCHNPESISFFLYQDCTERAGVHITISNEVDKTGHPPAEFKIIQVQRIYTTISTLHRNNPLTKEKLPILLAPKTH